MKKRNFAIEELASKISTWSAGLQNPTDKKAKESNFKLYNEILNQLGHNVHPSNGQLIADMDEKPFYKVALNYEGYKNLSFTFSFKDENLRLLQISSLKVDTKADGGVPGFSQVSGGLQYSMKNLDFTTSIMITANGFFPEDLKITEVKITVDPPFHWWK